MLRKNDLPRKVQEQKEFIEFINSLDDNDLCLILKSYWETVYASDCSSYKDVIALHRIEAEVRRRGYTISSQVTVHMIKHSMDTDTIEDVPKQP